MTRSPRSTRTLAVAVVAVLAASSVLGLSLLKSDADQTSVYAYFRDASPLIVGNDVKMSGVKVGVIDSIKVENGQARVGLRLEKAAQPLHVDATATVRPVGLLGERFVDLQRGTADKAAIPVGGRLPVEQTGSVTDLDQVLNTIDQPTGSALAALVTTLGEGLTGTGADANAAIKALAPSMTDTRQLVKVLDDQSTVLTSLIDSLQPLAGALATDQGKQLDRLVGSADDLLSATARQEEAFDSTLAQLPGALEDARKTLRTLTRAARSTTPTLRELRPTTDKLVQLGEELTAFAKVADPALKSLDPVLVQGRALIDNARPIAASLRRAGPDLRGTAKGARPVVNDLLGNLRNVLDFVKYWAMTTNGEDGLSHYFRAHYVFTPETLTGLIPAVPGTKATKTPKPPGLGLPELPLLGGLLAGTGDLVNPLLGNTLGLVGGLLNPRQQGGSATGLSQQQENSLLDSLIGGR